MIPLRSITFLVTFFGACAYSWAVPIIGVANYMLIYQIFPEHAWWHHALVPLGIRYSMTAALCMMFGIILNLPRLPRLIPFLSLWDITVLGIVAVAFLSEFVAPIASDFGAALTDKFLKIMLFLFCLTRVVTVRKHFQIVMWALVLGSLYIGYDAWTAPRGAFEYGRLQRIGGPDFRHSSGLAAHMSAMIPLIAVTYLTARSKFWRLVALVSGALTVNTVILCRTRSAFLGLGCGAVVALLFAPKRRRTRTYLFCILGAVCAYTLTDQPFWDRMATLSDQQTLQNDPAATGRLAIWKAAWEMIAQYPWGVGIGHFQAFIGDFNPAMEVRAAHNTFLLCWAEMGTQGFVLFVLLLLITFSQIRRSFKNAPRSADPVWTRYMSYGFFLSLTVSLTTQIFTERLYTEAFWWLLALPGCLCRVVANEREAMEAPALAREDDLGFWRTGGGIGPIFSPQGAARGAFA